MKKYKKIIILDTGFVILAIILFSPAFVGLSFTEARYILLSLRPSLYQDVQHLLW